MNLKKISLIFLFFIIPVALSGGPQIELFKDSNIEPLLIKIGDQPGIMLDGKEIPLDEIVIDIVKKNYDLISGRYDLLMTDSDYLKYQTKYSPFLNLKNSNKHEDFPEALESTLGQEKKTWESEASIAKSFSSGTTFSAGLKHVQVKNKFTNDLKYKQPLLFLGMKQEFLKNFFGHNDRREIKILKNVKTITKEMILFDLSLKLMEVISEFWDVIIKEVSLANAMLQEVETKKLRNIIRNNVKLGIQDDFNLNYYNALVLGAEAKEITLRREFQESLRDFFRSINLDKKESSKIKMPERVILTNKLPDINFEESLKKAYSQRVDYRQKEISLESAKLDLAIRQNEALPSLQGSLNITSLAQDEKTSDAYSDGFSFKNPSFEALFEFTYPLDNKEQEVAERNALFALEKAEIDLKKYRRIVHDDIASKINLIKTSHKLYQKSKKIRIESEIFYKKLVKNLRRGRLNAADVKNALDGLIESRQAELESLVYFDITLLQFDVAKNELWKRFNIDIHNYLPKTKR